MLVLLYILYLRPSGSPAHIIWDIHRSVFLLLLYYYLAHIYLGYPQCCVTLPLTASSSLFLVCILLWLQHCVCLTVTISQQNVLHMHFQPLCLQKFEVHNCLQSMMCSQPFMKCDMTYQAWKVPMPNIEVAE